MGYSITQELHDKIEQNRRDGRLCGGPTSTNHHCSKRAQWRVIEECWTYKIGEGQSRDLAQPMCTRHAKQYHIGMRGVNFIVDNIVRIDS